MPLMPYAFEARHSHLLPQHDKRRKLTAEDKARIRELHAQGWAVRAIAREYAGRCSRRLIQFVIFPDRLEAAAEGFRLRRLDGRYYERGRQAKAIREHRRRKQRLIKGVS